MDQFIGSRRLLVATNQETIVTSEALLFRDLIKSKKKAKRLTTSFLHLFIYPAQFESFS